MPVFRQRSVHKTSVPWWAFIVIILSVDQLTLAEASLQARISPQDFSSLMSVHCDHSKCRSAHTRWSQSSGKDQSTRLQFPDERSLWSFWWCQCSLTSNSSVTLMLHVPNWWPDHKANNNSNNSQTVLAQGTWHTNSVLNITALSYFFKPALHVAGHWVVLVCGIHHIVSASLD